MTYCKLAFLFFAMSVVVSCGKEEESELKLDVPISTAYVLPLSQATCDAKLTGGTGTVTVNSFQFKSLTINWANTADKVTILQLQVYFKNSNISGGDYSCSIVGDELTAAFNTSGVRWSAEIDPTLSASNSCPITCGGFNVVNKDKPFTIFGTVTASGIQKSSATGDEKFVKGTTDVKLIFQGGF